MMMLQKQTEESVKLELEFRAVIIINILVKNDHTWLAEQSQIAATLRHIWVSDDFQERHRKVVCQP